MTPELKNRFRYAVTGLICFWFCACASSGTVVGNEGGSAPINDQEKLEYEKAVVRCLKTGGTRVVKIMGSLRCY